MEKHVKISLIISGSTLGLLVVSILLHNTISGFSGTEEPVFFLLSLLLGILVLPASVIYLIIALTIAIVKKYKR